jgi:hypothetical protein
MKADSETPALKLFVTGTSTGDPDQWEPCGNKTLVIAASKEDACRMTGWHSAAEVDMSRPRVLTKDAEVL